MSALVVDIETVGEDFNALDATTQEVLTRWIAKEAGNDTAEYEKNLTEFKEGLGFSPLTGQIVAIGVYDIGYNKGVVYYQAPGSEATETVEDNITYKRMEEAEMLQHFWAGVAKYTEIVTFNGRGFDVPFLMIRSAINHIRPSADLMSNRYLSSQWRGPKHIDLQDQLSFYGAMRKRGALHTWCRAFGIKSPKSDGVSGDDVAALYREKKFLDIARYNVGDLQATKALYEYWRDFVAF